MSISLIKLKNGVEIIGQVVRIDDKILLEDPMQVNYRLGEGSSLPVISFSRYCPLSMEDIFQFDKDYILHVTPVKRPIEKYYEQAIEQHKTFTEKHIEEEFINAVQSKEVIEQEVLKKFLEKVKIHGISQ